MNISEFLALEGAFELSPDQSQRLNRSIANVSATDIPVEKIGQVLDYLIVALKMNSVDPQMVPAFDRLVIQLQEVQSEA